MCRLRRVITFHPLLTSEVKRLTFWMMDPNQLETLLRVNGFRRVRRRTGNIGACCPSPEHAEDRPSWGISTEAPHLHGCFACGYSGRLYTLLLTLGYRRQEAAVLGGTPSLSLPEWTLKDNQPEDNSVQWALAQRFWSYRPHKAVWCYFRSRNFRRSTYVKSGARYSVAEDAIAIPWRAVSGRIEAVVYRHLSAHYRYEFAAGVKKQELLYVPDYNSRGRRLVLCEGEFDALRLAECREYSAALGHAQRLSDTRLEQVCKMASHVVLAFDSDFAGCRLARKVAGQLLVAGTQVSVVQWSDSPIKQDPAACTVSELQSQLVAIKSAQASNFVL